MRPLTCLAAFWLAVLGGCATPSVHPIYADTDPALHEPGLVGTWKADSGPTYTLSRAGDGYHLLVRTNDPKKTAQWEFAVRLVQIGEHRFADFSAPEKQRESTGERWGPFFVATHLFARWDLDGDALTVWLPKREWLEKALADKTITLGHTRLNKDTLLITAPTAELQAFLKKYGADAGAFADRVELIRHKE